MSCGADEAISNEKIDIVERFLDKNGLSNTISLFNAIKNAFGITKKYTGAERSCDTGLLNDCFGLSWVVYPSVFDFITLDRKQDHQLADAVAAYVNGKDSTLIDNYDKNYKEREEYCLLNDNRKLVDLVLLRDVKYDDKEIQYSELAEELTKLLNPDGVANSQSITIKYDANSKEFIAEVNSFNKCINTVIESNVRISKPSLYTAFAYIYYFAYNRAALNNSNIELFRKAISIFRETDGMGGMKLLDYVIRNKWETTDEEAAENKVMYGIYGYTPRIKVAPVAEEVQPAVESETE